MPKLLLALAVICFVLATFTYLPLKRSLLYTLHLSGDTTTACCTVTQLSQTGDFEENAQIAMFEGLLIDYPKTSLAQEASAQSTVLGITNGEGKEKWIEVSLAQQQLRAWEGDTIVMEYPISSGKWFPTPKGDFHIWYKTRFQRMTGGSKELGTYYDLPNVPYNMFFYGSFGIHGAYWHNNFGHPMSHGCVNEPIANAKELFEWAGPVLPDGKNAVKATADNPGTRVFIH